MHGTVFLLVGRVLPLKGFARFLEAWSLLSSTQHSQAMAVIVGDGESLPELKQLAQRLGITNVRFAGKQPREELARYYAAADVFVFPSQVDVWGLVVNEALCFGLPVLASRYAGASQALIADEGVGQLFDPLDQVEFVNQLCRWVDTPPQKNPVRAREILSEQTFEHSVQAIDSMLQCVHPSTAKIDNQKPIAQNPI
jgi:glycosyltransferase involved in cell wall biosynthesis